MTTDIRMRNADRFVTQFPDRHRSPHGMSRRQFLARAAALGLAAFGTASEVLGAPPVWREATLVKEGDKTIVVCKGKGKTCAVLRLVSAKRLSSFHDADLAKCTDGINAILDELMAKNRVPSRHPCFIVTPYAPFLAWSEEAHAPRARKETTLADDATQFYQALGIPFESYRPKPTRFWYWIGGGVGCKKGGDTQIVARLINAEKPSPLHDAVLAEYTNRINSVLDTYGKRNPNPELRLCFLVTPKGLFLAWSTDDDRAGPAPIGAITALDEEGKVLQALGI